MTPDQDLSARLAGLLAAADHPDQSPCCAIRYDQACGDAYRSGQLITLADHNAAVQAAVAKAVEAERARMMQIVADRKAMYEAKAARHEADITDTCSEWEKIQHTITSYDYFDAAIRSRGVAG